MEDVLQTIGVIGFILLVLAGLLAGWLASLVAGGRHRGAYLAIGVLGALVTPFIVAILGGAVLAAGGLLAIIAMALVGAAVVLVIGKLILD
ncbi:GlsB/YeaQ/YmgE family stress response membrane protein [uncultured Thioclava sp.]|uniref:GlsB/YeaQ/YmgE family stress response membrane protein n=1 Tax=Thioclava arctica TaxID=3238301 RepID=A0ABV3TGR5_9RHOB|nr:GlsB/YeaQ/YmgE family stress response membrane protein [uncultured Thioclava sp.]